MKNPDQNQIVQNLKNGALYSYKIMRRFMVLVLQTVIKAYQILHKPFFRDVCRFYPSCSEYSIEALQEHGPLKGSVMSVLRILRCNPFFKGGYDPVPLKNKKAKCKPECH
jgi:uncharacterized protein